MNFHAVSYFAGIGTVLATLTLGFGGGILMSGVIADKTPREPSRVARQMAERTKPEEPPAVAARPVEPSAVAAMPVVPTTPQREVAATPRLPPSEPEPALAPPRSPPQAQPQPQALPRPQLPTTVQHAPPSSRPISRWSVVYVPAVQEHLRAPDDKAQEAKRRATREATR